MPWGVVLKCWVAIVKQQNGKSGDDIAVFPNRRSQHFSNELIRETDIDGSEGLVLAQNITATGP
jgi:hypothetical protein